MQVATPLQSRRQFSQQDKIKIVQEAYAQGSSVAIIAKKYQIQAGLIYKWKGKVSVQEKPSSFTKVRLPVQIKMTQSIKILYRDITIELPADYDTQRFYELLNSLSGASDAKP